MNFLFFWILLLTAAVPLSPAGAILGSMAKALPKGIKPPGPISKEVVQNTFKNVGVAAKKVGENLRNSNVGQKLNTAGQNFGQGARRVGGKFQNSQVGQKLNKIGQQVGTEATKVGGKLKTLGTKIVEKLKIVGQQVGQGAKNVGEKFQNSKLGQKLSSFTPKQRFDPKVNPRKSSEDLFEII